MKITSWGGAAGLRMISRVEPTEGCIQESLVNPKWAQPNHSQPEDSQAKHQHLLLDTCQIYPWRIIAAIVDWYDRSRQLPEERTLSQVYSFDVQKYIYFQQFHNHCLFFFTVEIFKWNNKTKNSICTYTVYIDMTHAFVFQCLVQVLQLSAPFNPWNEKAGSLEIVLILCCSQSSFSRSHSLNVSQRRMWTISHKNGQVQNLASPPIYIYSIPFL